MTIARMALVALLTTAIGFAYFAPKGEPDVQKSPQASTPAPSAKKSAPQPTVDKSEAAQQKRWALIQKLIKERVFLKIEMPGSLPRLWVAPRFHSLDFDTKRSFVSVVYAYHFDGANLSESVRIFDGRTGKEIGSFSIADGGLRLF